MAELGGLDIGMPQESAGNASEQLSEQAKERFAASAAAMAQIRREEKRSRRRDDQVAKAIAQFLAHDNYSHLFVLISRLVARDCPSVFILGILSLIDEACLKEVQEYLQESLQKTAKEAVDENVSLLKPGVLDQETNRTLVEWITRLQMVMTLDPERILVSLMLDEKNIDGTVLQLTAFVLQEYFHKRGKAPAFEGVQPLAASILQTVFEPFIAKARKKLMEERAATKEKED